MKDSTSTVPREAKAKSQRGPYRELGAGASAEAKRLAAAILEVLAGSRTPTQAADALSLSLPRYYQLESRALHGMLLACEPRSLGRGPSPPSALASLQRECEQLRRECGRQQALVRAAQRAIGLPQPAAPRGPQRDGKKRRRRPTARALKAAARLTPENVTVMTPTVAVSV